MNGRETSATSQSSATATRTAAVDRYQYSGEMIKLSKVLTYPDILHVVDSSALEIAHQLPWTAEQLQKLDAIAAKVRDNLATDQVMKRAIFTALWDYMTFLDVDGVFGQPVMQLVCPQFSVFVTCFGFLSYRSTPRVSIYASKKV
jgi:hypothetical protein